ncbi:hypothetical protein [Streptomyces sp. LN785]|uniref:hypothetical protein n=1 Tax=Streptomyces sp. LN785 TaxID=3112983 RepID=UPI00371C9819
MTTADSPHRADGWTAAVRQRLGLGRLLPLGGPADGVWISERAAVSVLRRWVCVSGPGPVLGEMRIVPADPDAAPHAALPPPPSALPPGPLRIEAAMSATADQPLPAAAAVLRSALLEAAAARLGLVVTEVDLRVTELLDTVPDRPAPEASGVRGAEPEGTAGVAAAGVPGVAALTRVLGNAVHTDADHVRVELATDGSHQALDVALAVRVVVAAALAGHPPVTVLVTAVVDAE